MKPHLFQPNTVKSDLGNALIAGEAAFADAVAVLDLEVADGFGLLRWLLSIGLHDFIFKMPGSGANQHSEMFSIGLSPTLCQTLFGLCDHLM